MGVILFLLVEQKNITIGDRIFAKLDLFELLLLFLGTSKIGAELVINDTSDAEEYSIIVYSDKYDNDFSGNITAVSFLELANYQSTGEKSVAVAKRLNSTAFSACGDNKISVTYRDLVWDSFRINLATKISPLAANVFISSGFSRTGFSVINALIGGGVEFCLVDLSKGKSFEAPNLPHNVDNVILDISDETQQKEYLGYFPEAKYYICDEKNVAEHIKIKDVVVIAGDNAKGITSIGSADKLLT